MALIENWESGSLSSAGWTVNNGDVYVTTNASGFSFGNYEGSYALETSAYAQVFSNSNEFQQGQQLDARYASTDHFLDDDALFFGASGTGADHYELEFYGRQGPHMRIQKDVGGSDTTLAAYNNNPRLGDIWHRVHVDWGSDGQIVCELYDDTDTLLKSISATDTTFTGGKLGFYHGADVSPSFWDYIEVNGGTGPQSATLESPSLTASAQPLSATNSGATATSDVTRGLISKWTLDGDALDQVGTLDPSTVSGVTYTGGYIDQAASFDGSDYIEYPSDGSIQTNDFTISAWANVNSTSSGTTAIQTVSAKNLDHTDRQFWLVEWDGAWVCRIGSNGQGVVGPAATPGAWTHLLATYDSASDTFELWVNGVSAGTATESTIGGAGQTFCIGAESPDYRMFGGLIDEVRYYDVVLTDQEIADLYAYDGTASLVTASLDSASLAFSPRALGATPGATGATLGAATANLAASTVGVSPGAISATIESTGLTSSAASMGGITGPTTATLSSVGVTAAPISPTAAPGPISAGMETATLSTAAYSIGGEILGLVADLDVASLSASPSSVASITGPVSVGLDSSSLIALSRPLGVSEAVYAALDSAAIVTSPGAFGATPGAVSATVDSAALTSLAESPVVALAELSVEIDACSLAVSVENVAPVPGAVSADLDSASLVVTVHDVEALLALVATLDVASLTPVLSDIGAVPGVVSPELEIASASLLASDVDFSLGSRPVGLDVADLVAQLPELSAENIKYLFLRVSEAGNSGFTLDGDGAAAFSVDSAGENRFELDSGNENSL